MPTVPDISVPSTAAPTTAADQTPAPAWLDMPAAGSWEAVSDAPIPARTRPVLVDMVDSILVWGGEAGGTWRADGAVYDYESETWRAVDPAPIRTAPATPVVSVWTGGEVVLLGRGEDPGDPGFGVAFNPFNDSWRALPAPGGRVLGAVWTGERIQALWETPGVATTTAAFLDGSGWQPLPVLPEAPPLPRDAAEAAANGTGTVWYEGDWTVKFGQSVWSLPAGATEWKSAVFRDRLAVRPETVLTNREYRVYLASVCGATLQIDAASASATAIGKTGCEASHTPASVNNGWLLDAWTADGSGIPPLILIEPATSRLFRLPEPPLSTRSSASFAVLPDGSVFAWGGGTGTGGDPASLVDGALWVPAPPAEVPEEEEELENQ